jgi:hypothetical protein
VKVGYRQASYKRKTPSEMAGFFFGGAPSMGALLRVQVPPRADHSERSEAQLHEGNRVWEGSVEHKS